MTLRVLGAGFGRTGTLSLKSALEQLGLTPCYHMVEVMDHREHAATWCAAAHGAPVDWVRFLAGYAAAVDWPAAAFWREILAAIPDARVILTVRPGADWYASFEETILANVSGPPPPASFPLRSAYDVSRDVVLERVFDGRAADARHAIEVFADHNREVAASVDPSRLLVYDVGTGWGPLCSFLGVSVPDSPFPHLNERDSFRREHARRRRPTTRAD